MNRAAATGPTPGTYQQALRRADDRNEAWSLGSVSVRNLQSSAYTHSGGGASSSINALESSLRQARQATQEERQTTRQALVRREADRIRAEHAVVHPVAAAASSRGSEVAQEEVRLQQALSQRRAAESQRAAEEASLREEETRLTRALEEAKAELAAKSKTEGLKYRN